MTASAEAGRAAELVCFALQPKVARGADERYSELWSAYRTDGGFRDIVDAVADGLGLVVIDAPEQGLIVAPSERSPFTFRLVDYQVGLDPAKRMLIGLVQLGIAATAYPREADLEDDIVVRRSPDQVERFLRSSCQVLADAETQDPETSEELLVYREYLSRPSATRTQKGGYKADCTLGIITRAFGWLVEQGMARAVAGTDSYQLLDRYRVQVREMAGHAALERLRALVDPSAAEVVAPGAANDADDADDAESPRDEVPD
jgi:hypothetical protein